MSTTSTLTESELPQTSPRALHIGLWVVQGLLFLAFVMAGSMKLTTPLEELARNMPWVSRMPGGLVRFIGVAEVSGALGLLLPSLFRILPKLSALAGAGLTVVMVLAASHHLMNGEAAMAPVNVVLGGLAAFVAWGRGKRAPIQPRR